jgi:hypothetical protein
MNRITFCSDPDTENNSHCFGLENFNDNTIKEILNHVEDDTTFYLIDKKSSNQWLNIIRKKVKIIFDCNNDSIQQIKHTCQKK